MADAQAQAQVELLAIDPAGDLAWFIVRAGRRMWLATAIRDENGEWCRG